MQITFHSTLTFLPRLYLVVLPYACPSLLLISVTHSFIAFVWSFQFRLLLSISHLIYLRCSVLIFFVSSVGLTFTL